MIVQALFSDRAPQRVLHRVNDLAVGQRHGVSQHFIRRQAVGARHQQRQGTVETLLKEIRSTEI